MLTSFGRWCLLSLVHPWWPAVTGSYANLRLLALNNVKIKFVKKGEFIQREGDVDTFAYEVKSGLIRSYTIDRKGREHIFMFGPEGWVVADSTESGVAAELFIDAVEDSVVAVIEKDVVLAREHVDKLIKRLSVLQTRVLMLMGTPAIERFDHFQRTYPDIMQRVPQRMVASYLGITPEALSKAKAEQAAKLRPPRS